MGRIEPEQRRGARVALALILLCGLGSCSKFGAFDRDTTVVDGVVGADLSARHPAQLPSGRDRQAAPGAQVYPGSSAVADGASASGPMAEGVTPRAGEGYDINFNNAEISAVAKALLGDLLGATYSVDSRVQGTISLSSGRPIPRAEILPLLETVLKYSGATIVREGGVYKITTASEEIGAGSTDRFPAGRLRPGHGLTVLPLRYVTAPIVMRALDSFAVRPGMLRMDQARNVLLVVGTSPERARAVEAALALDVDWMRNQSVGIFPVSSANPETVIAELQNIFDSGKEGAAGQLVRFQPVMRLNAVLAIAQTPGMIDQVRRWVSRLDRADYENTSVRVYRVRFGNARVMAAILREVFTGQPSTLGAPGSADLSQLTPGSTAQRATTEGAPSLMGSGSRSSTSTSSSSSSTMGRPGDSTAQSSEFRRPGDPTAGLPSLGASGSQTPILTNVRITADTANNALLIYANRDQYKIVERAIFELDRAPMQVAIDVTIAEITLKNDLQYGVQFYLKGKDASASLGFGVQDILPTLVPGAGNIVFGARDDPRVVINALRKLTDVKVLSSPSLVVVDNQQAMLQVGDEVPIATQSSQSVITPGAPVINTIEMRNTGVILRVTPRVNANGNVMLDIVQEISNVVRGEASLTPTISQRRIQSSISVASGQTVLLGGLISTRQERGKTGLPILSDIKIIGDLLGQHLKLSDRTELIMFIRPQVIRDGVDAQLVAEELRSKLNLLGRGRPNPQPGAPRRR